MTDQELQTKYYNLFHELKRKAPQTPGIYDIRTHDAQLEHLKNQEAKFSEFFEKELLQLLELYTELQTRGLIC
jgi:hypothetical protein